jgi:hypothetical protein
MDAEAVIAELELASLLPAPIAASKAHLDEGVLLADGRARPAWLPRARSGPKPLR